MLDGFMWLELVITLIGIVTTEVYGSRHTLVFCGMQYVVKEVPCHRQQSSCLASVECPRRSDTFDGKTKTSALCDCDYFNGIIHINHILFFIWWVFSIHSSSVLSGKHTTHWHAQITIKSHFPICHILHRDGTINHVGVQHF